MGFVIDPLSRRKLDGVHPDLVKVVEDCAANGLMPFAFGVSEGLRTLAEQQANVAKGVSQTMHSRHLPNSQGLSCAVDLVVLVDGKVTWSWPPYHVLADQMKASATRLGIPIEWGGDWTTLKDGPHYQLPWDKYP